jgi:Asp-tRNA(Asn)/Glu-tRNA(Gln) amidotransferase A subunit family amidase
MIPVNSQLDGIGPMTRRLSDAVLLLKGMVDHQEKIPSYLTGDPQLPLEGLRIGYVTNDKHKIDSSHRKLWREVKDKLVEAGLQLIPISNPRIDHIDCESEFVMTAGLRLDLHAFLKSLPEKVPVHSLEELNHYNTTSKREGLKDFAKDFLTEAEALENPSRDMKEKLGQCRKMASDWYRLAASRQVSLLIDLIPSQSVVWSDFHGVMSLTLPLGVDRNGQHLGLGLFAMPGQEEVLFALATRYESFIKELYKQFPPSVLPE